MLNQKNTTFRVLEYSYYCVIFDARTNLSMPFYPALKRFKKDSSRRIASNLLTLRNGLRQEIPRKTLNDTLLLGTWNIRDFDSNKFGHGPRLPESYFYIAEIISAFDLVAVQEINEDIQPLKRVQRILGPNWNYIITDVTETSLGGNGERLGFLFDTRKILFRDAVGEIVLGKKDQILGGKVNFTLPTQHKIKIGENMTVVSSKGQEYRFQKGDVLTLAPKHRIELEKDQDLLNFKQFARTPFLIAFQSGWFKFNLCTVHLYYGDSRGDGYARRVKEINALTKFFNKRATKDGENYILLGDFNVISETDETFDAIRKNGFQVPQGLFKSNLKQDMFYDQIVFKAKPNELRLGPSKKNSGVFNFSNYVFKNDHFEDYKPLIKNQNLTHKPDGTLKTEDEQQVYYQREWRTWQMSDHLLLWVELQIDFSDDYLTALQ